MLIVQQFILPTAAIPIIQKYQNIKQGLERIFNRLYCNQPIHYCYYFNLVLVRVNICYLFYILFPQNLYYYKDYLQFLVWRWRIL